MALGTDHQNVTTEANFIPEIWSNEIIAVYENSLQAAKLVRKMGFVGKKGDTVHVPKPVRGAANAKSTTAGAQVVLNANNAGVLDINIDKHYEYSILIEDFTEVQRLTSARAFYTQDAGYALAKQVDTDLLAVAAGFQGGSSYSGAVIGSDGSTNWNPATTGNGSNLTDAGLRRVIQTLDDSDVPMDQRSLLINPGQKNVLLGIDRFNSSDFIGSDPRVKSGKFGDIYGVSVYTSTNLATVTAADSVTNYKACILMHRDAIVHVEQMKVRTQTQYKQEYLGTLFTADTIYGVAEYRDLNGVAIMVPA